jgi:hypothetical protein
MPAPVDTLTAMLRATERWLCEGVEDSPETVERMRAGIESALGRPLPLAGPTSGSGRDAAGGDQDTHTGPGKEPGAEAGR